MYNVEMDERELTKKIAADAIEEGVIPPHMMRYAREYAETGRPSGVVSGRTNWAETAVRFVVEAKMWKRTKEEVVHDGRYNTGFICRYGEMCRRYGVRPNGQQLDLCLTV
jgi:hypothetical protein